MPQRMVPAPLDPLTFQCRVFIHPLIALELALSPHLGHFDNIQIVSLELDIQRLGVTYRLSGPHIRLPGVITMIRLNVPFHST